METLTARANIERSRQVRNVLAGVLAANWAVAILKLVIGLSRNSAAVTADGLHSFIDGGSNVLGLVAMSIAAQPADADHPYGHGKFEALASLGIGGMVGMGMLELGRLGFDSLMHNQHPIVNVELMVVMLGSLAMNLIVSRIERSYGRGLKSAVLLADSTHTLSDAFVTLSVLTSLVLVWMGFPRADGIVALLVMVFVAVVAYRIVRQAIGSLSDTARLNPEQVASLTAAVAGVQNVKNVRSRGMEESIYVDLKIEVDPSLPTSRAHAVADEVERRLTEAFPQIVDVVVHVEPAELPRRP